MEISGLLTNAGLISIFGLLYKLNIDLRKDSDGKVKRLYGRLDEIKEKNDKDYTKKEVCNVIHEQITKDFTEIKLDLKEIKQDIKSVMRKNGF